ncbi:unnamed protein product, partial [Larinioides sclopetarius]
MLLVLVFSVVLQGGSCGSRFPPVDPTMKPLLLTTPDNSSATLELSKNISTVLEQLLQNYDNRQRPDH